MSQFTEPEQDIMEEEDKKLEELLSSRTLEALRHFERGDDEYKW